MKEIYFQAQLQPVKPVIITVITTLKNNGNNDGVVSGLQSMGSINLIDRNRLKKIM